jgi:hypothetical protein
VATGAISERIAGLSLAAMSAALWALGGIAAQELFSRHHVDPGAWSATPVPGRRPRGA